jgi:dolichol kinase
MTGETKRQIEHILPLGFAFLLPYLTLLQAVALCFGAAFYGLFVSGRVNREGVRENEKRRGWSIGKLSYALVVLILILLFQGRIHIACGAWAVLALGDAVSNLAGRAWGRTLVPWSATRTWIGLAAFAVSSWLGSMLLVWWAASVTGYALPGTAVVAGTCLAASVVAAFVETLPLPLDDNLTSPLAAAGILALVL